ncbi:hypothetical protein [Halomonas sp. I5-271120]|uniref:hypothetical protein n=1 Tax=Halomonas sp. I5-271120 TaxID=3061632 RepID=UPI002714962E|nr:hypothetical protein [Halomonas sp. I5-271120]
MFMERKIHLLEKDSIATMREAWEEERFRLGLSVEKAASELGVHSKATFLNIMHGTHPIDERLACRISELLSLPLDCIPVTPSTTSLEDMKRIPLVGTIGDSGRVWFDDLPAFMDKRI